MQNYSEFQCLKPSGLNSMACSLCISAHCIHHKDGAYSELHQLRKTQYNPGSGKMHNLTNLTVKRPYKDSTYPRVCYAKKKTKANKTNKEVRSFNESAAP